MNALGTVGAAGAVSAAGKAAGIDGNKAMEEADEATALSTAVLQEHRYSSRVF